MGSLDAQAVKSVAPLHGFCHSSPDHGDGSGYFECLSPFGHGYNPFAAGCEWEMKHASHHLAPGCRALEQGYPVATSVQADRSAPSGGYNPFVENCAFEDEVGPQQQFGDFEQHHVLHKQQCSSLDYMRQFYGGHHHPHQAAAYSRHSHDLPPIAPAPETGIFSFRQQRPKPHRLLWLSEEEAEIIRLIRLSQMKEGFCCSVASASQERMSPAQSPVMAASHRRPSNGHESVGTPRRSARMTRLPLEEFSLPPSAQSTREQIGTGRSVQDDRQWITLHRQKTKDVAASRRGVAALRIQRAWRRYSSRLPRHKRKLGRKNPVKRSVSAQEAARVIQRFWRARRKLTKKTVPAKALPKTLKELYEVIKSRHAAKGLNPPTYAKFLKLIGRIHAATEGARVRRRLKSRRLKAVIKEIKEIRAVVKDMSRDTGPDASTGLLPQLSAQLRQKLTQLHTALQGPEDTARYLLRRGPATPLVIDGGSRSASPSRAGDQAHVRVLGSSQNESGVPSLRCSLFTVVNNLGASSETSTSRDSDCIQPRKARTSTETDSQDHLHTRTARRPPSQDFERKREAGGRSKLDQIPGSGRSSVTEPATSSSRQNVQLESSYPRQSQVLQDQWSESAIGSVRSSNHEHGTDDTDQQAEQNKPKRPFLRRKSAAVAPQKLDWSKVKPMVSSRLEPELKSKLQKNRFRENASKASSKKTNYNNVRSRLFNYQATFAEECTLAEDFTSRQGNGYAEIHTQVDMTSKARPTSETLTEEIRQEVTTQNFSYYEENTEDDMVNQHSSTASRVSSPSKSGSYAYRYAKARSRCSDAQWQSALEKLDKTSERNHSFRYPEGTSAAAPEAPNAADKPSSSETASYASPELETTFKHVMLLKQESKVTVHNLFGFQQERTTIPRLSPDSHIFHGSFSQKRRLHEMLIQEGHASQLHHDSLAFVSTRD